MRRVGAGGHGALGIEQTVVAGAKAKLDQGTRVRDGLILPAVVGLEAAESVFRSRIPLPGWLAGHVVLANESFLDLMGAFRINLLLALHLFSFCALPLLRACMRGSASGMGGVRLGCWMSRSRVMSGG